MDRLYTSTEILSWENNDVAIENAIEVLKARLDAVPATVLNDVLDRCDPDTHHGLIDWISTQTGALQQRRLPREWSPKRNRSLWILYAAADLDRPDTPPPH